MRSPFLCLLTAAVFATSTHPALAGRLDIAVIQYADARDTNEQAAAFAAADLFDITDSDSVESRDSSIRGGKVVFLQSLTISPGSSFANSTRIENQRADVQGSFNDSRVQVEIMVQEGVDIGLRKFRRKTYSADGQLSGGQTSIIGIRSSSGKTASAIKGQTKVRNTSFSTLIVAQYSK
ncbi:MAG: hypothetical protein WA771_05390 [Chthoniobacterales bacterium]